MKWILSLAVVMFLAGSVHAQTRYVSFGGDAAKQQAADDKTGGAADDDILNMDIDQLARTPVVVPSMDIPVTSVTKKESTVGKSAAAIFVITNEMIRRSGARSIPEALRMAPGLEVAQANSNTWAISCRGFNDPYAAYLLVLIDGRKVFNPDFSGVFWNVQDTVLEDIDRIEVIRGPGGTLWGENAVNGVINIITKKAKDTQGAYVLGGGGTHERDMETVRYGGCIGGDLQYRIYAKHFERGANYDPTGQVDDSWRQKQFGFRADWESSCNKRDLLTIQGDHYTGTTDNSIIPTSPNIRERLSGENILLRWKRILDDDSDLTLQTYYDNYTRIDQLQSTVVKILDIDFQYGFRLGDRHKITCGAEYRNVVSYFSGGDTFTNWFPTEYWTTNYANEFVQDDITIIEDRVNFILGCKLNQNPYTGLEYQPTARLLYTPDRRHTAWGAISRAVCTPNRVYRQSRITLNPVSPGVYPRVYGDPGVQSFALLAYELGYRAQSTDNFSWDITGFYNVYNQLLSNYFDIGSSFVELSPPPPHLVVPLPLGNGGYGDTYGVELAANYAVSERWRLYLQYTVLQEHLRIRLPDGSTEIYADPYPSSQIYCSSSWNIGENWNFDLMARYVDRLVSASGDVPSYISMDLRLGWRPRKELELAVVGQNLLQPQHLEFLTPYAYSTEVPRGMYGTLTWRR